MGYFREKFGFGPLIEAEIDGQTSEDQPTDYTADGKTYLEDFTVDSNIILGGKGKNGYCQIRNLRVYEVALTSEERMNNFLSLILDKTAQRQMLDFQSGNSLPTLTVTADFAGPAE